MKPASAVHGPYRRREEIEANRRRRVRRKRAAIKAALDEESETALAAEPCGFYRRSRDGRVRPGGPGPS